MQRSRGFYPVCKGDSLEEVNCEETHRLGDASAAGVSQGVSNFLETSTIFCMVVQSVSFLLLFPLSVCTWSVQEAIHDQKALCWETIHGGLRRQTHSCYDGLWWESLMWVVQRWGKMQQWKLAMVERILPIFQEDDEEKWILSWSPESQAPSRWAVPTSLRGGRPSWLWEDTHAYSRSLRLTCHAVSAGWCFESLWLLIESAIKTHIYNHIYTYAVYLRVIYN